MGNNIVEHTLNKVVFLDRDGTLNEEVNYLHKPEDMKLLPGVPQALKKLKDAGYTIIWLRNGKEVARTKITGDSYNLAEDGSWLNVTLDQGAQKSYQVQIKKEDKTFQSGTCQIPYYDSLRNGSFEVPACTALYNRRHRGNCLENHCF